jgi:hypothetical protein
MRTYRGLFALLLFLELALKLLLVALGQVACFGELWHARSTEVSTPASLGCVAAARNAGRTLRSGLVERKFLGALAV